jgi:hypothetical protein
MAPSGDRSPSWPPRAAVMPPIAEEAPHGLGRPEPKPGHASLPASSRHGPSGPVLDARAAVRVRDEPARPGGPPGRARRPRAPPREDRCGAGAAQRRAPRHRPRAGGAPRRALPAGALGERTTTAGRRPRSPAACARRRSAADRTPPSRHLPRDPAGPRRARPSRAPRPAAPLRLPRRREAAGHRPLRRHGLRGRAGPRPPGAPRRLRRARGLRGRPDPARSRPRRGPRQLGPDSVPHGPSH